MIMRINSNAISHVEIRHSNTHQGETFRVFFIFNHLHFPVCFFQFGLANHEQY